MQYFTAQELSQELSIGLSSILTNFPKVCAKQLSKGIKITKEGKGKDALYYYEEVEPQNVSYTELSQAQKKDVKELPNEIWIPCFCDFDYEVSNLGRFRNKETKQIFKGQEASGYVYATLKHSKKMAVHRLVLQSFDPHDNFEELTVDHVNGIRNDNRLENLRWAKMEENAAYMLMHRAELNKELTRLIQTHGYDDTLTILKSLN